jgi:phage terminase small subunit
MATTPKKKVLTPKEAAFVEQYLVDLNATQAAIRAGYSAKTAASIGFQNLTKLHIRAAIDKAQKRRAKRLEMRQDRAIAEAWAIAIADARELVEVHISDDGKSVRTVLRDTRYLSPQAAALYAGAKQGKYGVEIQMHSKLGALEMVFKHLGLYERDHEQAVNPIVELLKEMGSRAALQVVKNPGPDSDDD